jgi:hypothetical protein
MTSQPTTTTVTTMDAFTTKKPQKKAASAAAAAEHQQDTATQRAGKPIFFPLPTENGLRFIAAFAYFVT